MRKLFPALLLAAATALANAQELRLGPLTMTWPGGFEPSGSGPLFTLTGPAKVESLVSIRELSANEPADVLALRTRAAIDGIRPVLVKAATENGEIVVPLHEEQLGQDGTLLTVGAKTNNNGRSGFFLAYLIAHPSGRLALLTYEGEGEVAAQQKVFRPVFNSVRWDPR